MAVLKKGFETAGLEIQNCERDTVVDSADTGFTHNLITDYFNDTSDQFPRSFITQLAAGDTLDSATNKWIAQIGTQFLTNPANVANFPRFTRLRFISTNNVVGGEKKYVFSLNLEYLTIDFDFVSYLKMQNITKPGNAAPETNEDPASVDNVEAVVLHGRKYTTKEWANGFELNTRGITTPDPNFRPLLATTDGNFYAKAGDITPTGESRFRKPPEPWEVGTKGYSKMVIQPGKIYRDKLTFKTKISWNQFWDKVGANYCKQTGTVRDFNYKKTPFGLAHMVAVEKMMDYLTGASDYAVNLAFEVDSTLKARATVKKPPIAPILQVMS